MNRNQKLHITPSAGQKQDRQAKRWDAGHKRKFFVLDVEQHPPTLSYHDTEQAALRSQGTVLLLDRVTALGPSPTGPPEALELRLLDARRTYTFFLPTDDEWRVLLASAVPAGAITDASLAAQRR